MKAGKSLLSYRLRFPIHAVLVLAAFCPIALASGGADGIQHDIVGVLDLNGDGYPDVITTEELAGKNHTGLGVLWYENPGHFPRPH